MPRSPIYAAETKLLTAKKQKVRADELAALASDKLKAACVHAVTVGLTRARVAELLGVSTTYVAGLEGMPPGRNVKR